MRCGLIAKKLGMTRVFDEDARQIPVTLLKVENCHVVRVRNQEKDGYTSVCLSGGIQKESRLNKPEQGLYKKSNTTPAKKIAEFRVSEECLLPVGAELSVSHFIKGQCVDVSGTTQGKGFAGAMKRHNFGGLRASHGISLSHRSHGSTGQQGMSHVFKGKKMAGHMGNVRATAQNLIVYDILPEDNVLVIKGAIPGAKNGWVFVQDAEKKDVPKDVPMPAGLKEIKKAVSQETKDAEADVKGDAS
ncbi:MAG: 50S ribosomal protein L3 [Alphaproteobacteria bacterium]|nr:50S ribosomal protein L3 [Alphaproteobacteria bacterium]